MEFKRHFTETNQNLYENITFTYASSEIKNIERVSRESDVEVFQAGTALKNKKLISNGGRVLNITARANSLQEAKTKAYKAVALVEWEDGFYRNDIGWRAL